MVSPLLCDLREAAVPLWSICLWKGSSGRCSPCCLTRKSCVSVSHAVNNEGTVLTKLYSRPNTPQKIHYHWETQKSSRYFLFGNCPSPAPST